jgi:hypothetical protein
VTSDVPRRVEAAELRTAPTSGAGGLSVVVNDAVVEQAAQEIRRFASAAMLDFASTVGRIVFERFYGGDERTWRSHGAKDMSLRRLADRLGNGARFGAASLYRCVAIHLVLRRLGRSGRADDWTNLTPSHVRLVLPLDAPEQERLLRDAEAGAWSVRELESAVRARRAPARRGRARVPGFVRAVRRMERAALDESLMFQDLERAGRLDRETLEDLYRRVLRLREGLDLLQRALSPKRHATRRDRDHGRGST